MQPTPRLPAQPRFANGGCRRLRCFSAEGVTVGLAICEFYFFLFLFFFTGRARRRGDQRWQYPGRGARSAAAGTFSQRRRWRTRADSKYNSRSEGQLLVAAPPRSGTAAGSPAPRPGSASAPPLCRPEGTVGRTLPSAGGLRCSLPGRLGI